MATPKPSIPYAQFIGDNDPYPVIRSTPSRIAELCAGLSDEQLNASPEPGKWSLRQIVGHLADCELVFQYRVRMILFEDRPNLEAFDQDRWTDGWMREKETFARVFERFRVLRESSVRLFENTPAEDFRRTGTHPERGVQEAGDFLIIMSGHDINHLGQLERTKAAVLAG
jgi:uncharacterized damage-inducible protein DinB